MLLNKNFDLNVTVFVSDRDVKVLVDHIAEKTRDIILSLLQLLFFKFVPCAVKSDVSGLYGVRSRGYSDKKCL